MSTVLDLITGISWVIVYILAFWQGIKYKAYGIPGICICLNFSWELCVVLLRAIQHSPLNSSFIVQILWLILDFGVLYTWLRHSDINTWEKILLVCAAALLMAVCTIGMELSAESAFMINLVMSLVFLFRLDKQMRPSFPIALLKCIGTLSSTILDGIVYRNFLILAIGGLCLIADLHYLYDFWIRKPEQRYT